MSAFVMGKTSIKDTACLVDALVEMGWKLDQIEVHETPQHLYGYHGDQRPQRCEVIIRRKYVGSASNDLGFMRQEDGTFAVVVSEYDSKKHGTVWEGQLDRKFKCSQGGFAVEIGARAAAIQAERAAQKRGLKTIRRVDNVTKKITISISR